MPTKKQQNFSSCQSFPKDSPLCWLWRRKSWVRMRRRQWGRFLSTRFIHQGVGLWKVLWAWLMLHVNLNFVIVTPFSQMLRTIAIGLVKLYSNSIRYKHALTPSLEYASWVTYGFKGLKRCHSIIFNHEIRGVVSIRDISTSESSKELK